jgi:hypothetical protein
MKLKRAGAAAVPVHHGLLRPCRRVQECSLLEMPAKCEQQTPDHARVFSVAMRLLDYVSNFIPWTYNDDLVFGDKEFKRFYFWHFLYYERRKVVQSDIGWHFVANSNLICAWHLRDMHVPDIFFYDVALLR